MHVYATVYVCVHGRVSPPRGYPEAVHDLYEKRDNTCILHLYGTSILSAIRILRDVDLTLAGNNIPSSEETVGSNPGGGRRRESDADNCPDPLQTVFFFLSVRSAAPAEFYPTLSISSSQRGQLGSRFSHSLSVLMFLVVYC